MVALSVLAPSRDMKPNRNNGTMPKEEREGCKTPPAARYVARLSGICALAMRSSSIKVVD